MMNGKKIKLTRCNKIILLKALSVADVPIDDKERTFGIIFLQ